MIRLLTRNAGLKLLALAVAFVFWLNVASEPEMATIVSVPVEYSHHPENLEISSPITESIDVEASGPSGEIRDLRDAFAAGKIHEPLTNPFYYNIKRMQEIHLT